MGAGFRKVTEGLSNTIKGLLPSTLPTTSVGLSEVKAAQQSIAATLVDQISTNQQIKDELLPAISIAQSQNDAETLDSLYSRLDALGYTDPDKLTEQLNSVNQNITALDTMILSAAATETPNATLNVDNVALGISEEDVYNVASNPDLQTQPNVVYSENVPITQQYY